MACKIAQSQRLRLIPLGISQEQAVGKATKDNGGHEREQQQRSSCIFSHPAATSHAEISETITEICCNIRRHRRDAIFKKLILYLKWFDTKFNLVINAHRNMAYFLF